MGRKEEEVMPLIIAGAIGKTIGIIVLVLVGIGLLIGFAIGKRK